MKKIRFTGKIRYLGMALTVMQGIMLVVIAIFFLNERYMEVWRRYPEDGRTLTVYMQDLSQEASSGVESFLTGTADAGQLFIARKDTAMENDGTWDGFVLGVYGDPSGKDVALDFLNEEILSQEMLMTLLTSPENNSTLGVEQGSIYSVGEIPSFRFYEGAVVKKLPQLIKDSGTVGGTYVIWGLDSQTKVGDFLDQLSAVSGLSVDELTTADGGSASDSGLMRDIYFLFLGTQIFLNVIFFLVTAMKSLPKQGKLALLGWSPTAFAAEIFGLFGRAAIGAVPLLLVFGWLLSGWGHFSPVLLGWFLAVGLINLALTAVELFVSALVMLLTPSIDAIRGRICRRPLYALGIAAYGILSAGIVFCGVYVDQPMAALSENARLSREWEQVSDMVVLQNMGIGEDGDSFSGASNQLDQDLYQWYKDMAGQEGVYVIHTDYFDEDLLNVWRGSHTYEQVPQESLWLFTMSPNYLETLGIHADADSLEAAQKGARLYLLPDTLSQTQQETISQWLTERDTKSLEAGDIPTAFTQDPDFVWMTYTPSSEMFTWASDREDAMTDSAPVIYVAVPENMKYTETEGLKVSGLDGYLKFADEAAAQKWTGEEILSSYGLSDNEPVFAPVKAYIDGLQKDLAMTLVWFGGAFGVLLLILIGLLLVLASIYRLSNAQKLNVQKFLGYGFVHMYRGPVILLSLVIALEAGAAIGFRSRFGLVLVALAAVLQMVIFVKYMVRGQVSRVLIAFKGE